MPRARSGLTPWDRRARLWTESPDSTILKPNRRPESGRQAPAGRAQLPEERTVVQALDADLPFYLRDLHAPVSEEVEAFDLPIEGSLPTELDGLFVRNGPNPVRGDPGHWFLGDGMLHGVELSGGCALGYRNRFVQTRALRGTARYLDA